MRKTYCAIVVFVICAVGITACGSDESREDANDVLNGQVEKASPFVAAFNNGFPNVQHKCLTEGAKGRAGGRKGDTSGVGVGLRVIETSSSHGSRIVVIPDPHCPGFSREQLGIDGVGGNSP